MRRILPLLPVILMSMSFPARADGPEVTGSVPTHRVRVYLTGPGGPKVRAASARPYVPAPAAGPTQPYLAAKPGEGAPKH